ncbi:MAG: rhodanese-like domain-containing protein [Candidatus Paracaedibacteraceae bacterium]|nr:rhodanese-like domain-containing protein [Candidatus Paracaedibacteraceae bacterium]
MTNRLVPTVDVNTLDQWLNTDEVILIDVREEAEFAGNSIKEAILLPLSTFNPEQVPQVLNKKIVFQCRSGKRSEYACSIFLQKYPDAKAYNLEGGILEWLAANLPFHTTHPTY